MWEQQMIELFGAENDRGSMFFINWHFQLKDYIILVENKAEVCYLEDTHDYISWAPVLHFNPSRDK